MIGPIRKRQKKGKKEKEKREKRLSSKTGICKNGHEDNNGYQGKRKI